ncbi:MAE_28990/MAE_18760 family HEPN-like nuclease [Spirulina sp. CS-785/01]|uniref:MAE_28990/MAE_18760 family HEPN-like nuclease n=1 Tax=Spirulina sp. CS-785/01 TaxID=3021716 RepID=UPI002330B98F|nr:MAE_28990/MAE_18760 family HEPN-like nuclease [Spirulina sp. CS-785/01]MDB9311934.1 MAE_28990/MAE_18760 family HEPN-like nuclease [Spirulina sp. CS-785/01]
MKIRTSEQLTDKLDQELVWRKKELSQLKSLINTTYNPKKKVLLRSGITILYAHWEGFIKVAANSYLEFVAMQRLHYCELTNNFIAVAFKEQLDQAKATNKASLYIECFTFLQNQLSQRSNLPYKNVISTASNLTSSVFKEIVVLLGLDYSFYESKEVLIDEKLLKQRNNIAHGNYLEIDNESYNELHKEIIIIMDTFRNEIENYAVTEQYKVSTNQKTS